MKHVICDHTRVTLTDNNEIGIKLLNTECQSAHLELKSLARAMCSLGILDEFISASEKYRNLKPADPHYTED